MQLFSKILATKGSTLKLNWIRKGAMVMKDLIRGQHDAIESAHIIFFSDALASVCMLLGHRYVPGYQCKYRRNRRALETHLAPLYSQLLANVSASLSTRVAVDAQASSPRLDCSSVGYDNRRLARTFLHHWKLLETRRLQSKLERNVVLLAHAPWLDMFVTLRGEISATGQARRRVHGYFV